MINANEKDMIVTVKEEQGLPTSISSLLGFELKVISKRTVEFSTSAQVYYTVEYTNFYGTIETQEISERFLNV